MGRDVARVKETHLMASDRATACGVVTMMEVRFPVYGVRCSRRERCSSDVPGVNC